MAFGGVERNQELQDRSIYIDARSTEQRLGDTLLKHHIFRNTLIACAVACLIVPALTVVIVPVGLIMTGWWKGRIKRFRLPIRYPEWTGHLDPSNIDDNRGLCPAGGIEFLGTERTGRTNDRTMEIWASDSDVRTHRVIFGTTGAGKAQPNDAKVMTDKGWKPMGDIVVGDRVAVPDGGFASVLAIYPQGVIDVNKITFIDGRSTEACDNHLWEVFGEGLSGDNSAVSTTKEVACGIKSGKSFSLPISRPIEFTEKSFAIDPYLLGVYLSGGEAPEGVDSFSEKYIPSEYFNGSVDQRLALLRGLIENSVYSGRKSTGYLSCISFFSETARLAVDFQSLVWSLGGIAERAKLKSTGYFVAAQIEDNLKLRIASIEPIGKKESTCIFIDHPRHLYVTDDYVVTHNTESLLSILFNPLCWGSGFSMTDGKAQIDVTARVFVMAWMFWREDDVLILNYMRGGQDRFAEMINKPKVGIRKSRVSNTWNPFSTANHETINQIIDSIMEKASGDGAQWQAKAINMKNAVVQTIAYLRAKGDMLMSVATIREQMDLNNTIKLAMRNDIPPAAAAAIRSYLSSGLPGFNWAKAKAGKPQDSDTLLQHGYLTGQFTRTLGLMTDTYFDIFGDEIPEFDTSDVILNNRISFTMIPTLEKGVEEAGNLGKMQVASAKMMMSENLGYEIEGNYDDVVDNRQTNTRRPFYLVMDELGYYFAPGIDLMFAQGRSLQIALIAAGQDFQAMAKKDKNEVESMIANTRIKVSYKLEDPKETYEIFQKSGGRAAVAKISGYEMAESNAMSSPGQYNRLKNASIEETDRISLQELKKLGPGDGVMLYAEKVIRFKSFNLFMRYKFDKKKVNIKINTFLPIASPDMASIISKCTMPSKNKDATGARILSVLRGGEVLWSDEADYLRNTDPILAALAYTSECISNDVNITPQDKGIVLFMAAIKAMDDEAMDDESINMKKSKPAAQEKEVVKRNAGPALKGNELSFLNNPPIVEKKVEKPDNFDIAAPDWDDAPTQGEEAMFGSPDAVTETADEGSVDFSEPTKAELRKSITSLSGGSVAVSEKKVEEEIERTRKMVNNSCQFKENGKGVTAPPVAVSSPDEILSLLDSLSFDLAG